METTMHDCPLRGVIPSEECARTIWRATDEELDQCRTCEHGRKMAASSPFARAGIPRRAAPATESVPEGLLAELRQRLPGCVITITLAGNGHD
jgi:hypothetical protein